MLGVAPRKQQCDPESGSCPAVGRKKQVIENRNVNGPGRVADSAGMAAFSPTLAMLGHHATMTAESQKKSFRSEIRRVRPSGSIKSRW